MASGFEDWSTHAFTSASEEEQEHAHVTDAEVAMTFSSEVKSFTLFNNGPNPCHYAYAAGVDTDAFMLPSKAWIFRDVVTTSLYLICAAGETSTVYGAGFR